MKNIFSAISPADIFNCDEQLFNENYLLTWNYNSGDCCTNFSLCDLIN